MSPITSLFNQLPPDETLFENIAVALEQQGYVILPNALPDTVTDGLIDYLAEVQDSHFHPAAIGRGDDQTHNTFVRRDRIHWLDEENSKGDVWFRWTRDLRHYLNRRLLLGLFSFESQFAHYQPGDFYKKHVDAFRGQANRVLTLVTYLNRGWEPDQGGELVIYQETGEELARVTPSFGSLVIFLSEEFPHEVLPALRDRYSVAGWFRINNSIGNRIDPAR
ncbi:MAG: 2OG-Fe(II) oxygenase [Bacterioplanes sp.]|nr:2OG-Fe(II) oxygenase [Bacterioplanes sp.]